MSVGRDVLKRDRNASCRPVESSLVSSGQWGTDSDLGNVSCVLTENDVLHKDGLIQRPRLNIS